MAEDWSKYEVDPSKEDWSKYEVKEGPKESGTSFLSKLGSAGTGVAQGAALNWGPKLAGKYAEVFQGGRGEGKMSNLVAEYLMGIKGAKDLPIDSFNSVSPEEKYNTVKNIGNKFNQEEHAANPKSYLAGNVLGSVAATAPVGGGLSKLGQATGLGAKALGLGKIGQGFATGFGEAAPIGAVMGAGASEGDAGQMAYDTAKGAAAAGLTGGAIRSLPAIGSAMKSGAYRIAGKFAGAKDPGMQRQIGEYLMKKGLIKPFQSVEDTFDKIQIMKEEAGNQMGQAYQSVDKQGNFIDPVQVAEDFKAQYTDPLQQKSWDLARMAKNRGEIGETIDPAVTDLMRQPAVGQPAGKTMSTDAYALLKQKMDKDIAKFEVNSKYPPSVRSQGKQAYGYMSDKIDDIVQSKLGEEALKGFQAAKKQFGMADKILPLMTKAVRTEANRAPLSGVDFVAGGVGGVPGVAVKKSLGVLSRPGSGVAWMGDKVGDILQAKPEVFQKFAPILQNAAQRGPAALAAAIHVKSQEDEDFRNIMRQINGEKE